MARSTVRRLEVDSVPLEIWQADGLPPCVVARVLNVDDETGGRTLVIDLPAGWHLDERHWHSCDEEFFVLDGTLRDGDTSYRRGHYAFRPAGAVHGPVETPTGCRLLYWHESEFDIRLDRPPSTPEKPTIGPLDTERPADEWEALPVDIPTPIRMIRLRTFEETGCDNTLEWVPPFKLDTTEYHNADEEIYVLDGIAATDPKHVYVPGCYLLWKARTEHGPTQAWNLKAIVKHYGKHESFAGPPR